MKYCWICKESKDESNFKTHPRRKDGLQSQCIDCQRIYRKNHYEANKEKYIAKAKVHKEQFRDWWRDFKMTLKCSQCGENHPATLDFHHTDPSQKDATVSSLITLGNKKRILDEIEKCVVLCANCHRKFHYNE